MGRVAGEPGFSEFGENDHRNRCDEYTRREQEQREDNNIPSDEPIVFLEIYVRDASDFSADLNIHGVSGDRHRILRGESAVVANAIAGFLLYLRDDKRKVPHAYFNLTEGNQILYLLHYVLSGEGDVAPATREVLRKAEPNAQRRPAIHAGSDIWNINGPEVFENENRDATRKRSRTIRNLRAPRRIATAFSD
jgi:hypothetical protein